MGVVILNRRKEIRNQALDRNHHTSRFCSNECSDATRSGLADGPQTKNGACLVMTLSASQLSSAPQRRNQLIKICESLPEVTIEPANEHLKISVRKKTLAYYSFDHHGDGMISLVCKSNPSEQRRMIRTDPETFFVPDYLGTRGWLGIRLDLFEVDWDAVTEGLRRAYQDLAPKKLAALVD